MIFLATMYSGSFTMQNPVIQGRPHDLGIYAEEIQSIVDPKYKFRLFVLRCHFPILKKNWQRVNKSSMLLEQHE